ncbi:Zinc finger protein [Gossypium arboreum]|uniref:Zinc finger protein n=1 Tax=Gossypium arboreum TaxID=29729 RepID=A0A0B0N424_GOSAR|nr:Zinc finger protein [Gossypium arboreum]
MSSSLPYFSLLFQWYSRLKHKKMHGGVEPKQLFACGM